MQEENLDVQNESSEANQGGEILGLQKTVDENNSDANVDENNKNQDEQNNDDENNDENVAPDEYDFSQVELPDGVELDKDLTNEFSTAAKELNLSQTNADKFMAMGVKLSQKIQDKFISAINEARDNQIKAYETMLNTDKEIGGAKLQQSLKDANLAYAEFVSDDAAKLLADVGLNKHPAIVKVFMKIGKELKDDTIRDTGDSRKERTAADWYPNM